METDGTSFRAEDFWEEEVTLSGSSHEKQADREPSCEVAFPRENHVSVKARM